MKHLKSFNENISEVDIDNLYNRIHYYISPKDGERKYRGLRSDLIPMILKDKIFKNIQFIDNHEIKNKTYDYFSKINTLRNSYKILPKFVDSMNNMLKNIGITNQIYVGINALNCYETPQMSIYNKPMYNKKDIHVIYDICQKLQMSNKFYFSVSHDGAFHIRILPKIKFNDLVDISDLLKSTNESYMSEDDLVDFDIPDCLIDEPHDDLDDAYEKGKESKSKGYDIIENPYEYIDLRDAWESGFNSEFND